MEEPTDYDFERFHTLRDSNGNVRPPLLQSLVVRGRNSTFVGSIRYSETQSLTKNANASSNGFSLGDNRRARRTNYLLSSVLLACSGSHASDPLPRPPNGLVSSVLMADGLHRQVTKKDLKNLPARYERGNIKAQVRWFGAICVAGLGMFLTAYIIPTTGQVKTIWAHQYATCWFPHKPVHCPEQIACCGLFPNTPTFDNGTCAIEPDPDVCTRAGTYPDSMLCPPAVVNSVSYVMFAGIMIGMLTFGKIGDWIGRVRAGVLTSLCMLTGLAVMTFVDSKNDSTLFLVFAIFFGIFGLGVGGEYPLTALSAAEHHMQATEDALHDDEEAHYQRALLEVAKAVRRGETITLALAMQGVGGTVGSAYLLFLVYFSGQMRVDCEDGEQGGESGIEAVAANTIWRSYYLMGGTFTLLLLLYRTLVVEEGEGRAVLERRRAKREAKLGKGTASAWKIIKFYAPKIVGTSITWFMVDFSYYGLKVFSGPIFKSINPSGDLLIQNGYLVVYNLCAMVGLYTAAFIIDIPWIGRKRLSMASFAGQTLNYFLTAAIFNHTTPEVLMFLFFLGNYLSTAGADPALYLMSTESFPTEIRGVAQGVCAFWGKIGAFTATFIFSSVDTRTIFWACGAVNIVGCLFTFIFLSDLTGVSLAEQDAKFELFLEGRPERYKGKLNAPEHLSNFERWTGWHGEYDPSWAEDLVKEEMSKMLQTNAEASGEVEYSGDLHGMTSANDASSE